MSLAISKGSAAPVDGDRWGKLVETFAYGELLAQRHLTGGVATMGHYRDHQSREIDFLVETSAGELWGIEVKGSTQVHGNDFR
ncbi:MAG: DUF4143 domain-containing protein, partial [Puniceicoccales bacterium]|nr:DUF4143 domain-containing protein [Puniceicoccales bacterium]